MPETAYPLDAGFIRLRRDFFTSGCWAQLWREDAGLSTSLVPVLASLSSGLDEDGAHCRLRRLAKLSGLTTAEVQRARLAIRHTGAIDLLKGAKRGVWRFRTGEPLLARCRQPSFYLNRRLLTSGEWASMSRPTKATVVALAAYAKSLVILDSEANLPGGIPEWLEEIGAVGEYSQQPAARRVGVISALELQWLTGLPRHEAMQEFVFLAINCVPGVYAAPLEAGEDRIWYQPSQCHWAPESGWSDGFEFT